LTLKKISSEDDESAAAKRLYTEAEAAAWTARAAKVS